MCGEIQNGKIWKKLIKEWMKGENVGIFPTHNEWIGVKNMIQEFNDRMEIVFHSWFTWTTIVTKNIYTIQFISLIFILSNCFENF